MRVAGAPQRGGMHQRQMPRDELGKGGLGPGGGEFPQERQVVSQHSPIKWPPNGKPNKIFENILTERARPGRSNVEISNASNNFPPPD